MKTNPAIGRMGRAIRSWFHLCRELGPLASLALLIAWRAGAADTAANVSPQSIIPSPRSPIDSGLATADVMAQDAAYSEQAVKAAFLVNFPKYVDWPAESFAATNSPIVIAVLGETKVAGELQKMIADRTVGGREIVLKQLASGEAPGACQILFVAAAEQAHASDVLGKIKDESILTVGESDNFLDDGGIINLAVRNQKVALVINLAAADHARLKISSKLLSVAEVMKGRGN